MSEQHWYIMAKTAKEIIEEKILPVSEYTLTTIAKKHNIGRVIGRTLIFTPNDIHNILEILPCPLNSKNHGTVRRTSTSVARSSASASTRALALATEKRRKKYASAGNNSL